MARARGASREPDPHPRQVTALIINQWLDEWDEVTFDAAEHRSRPQPQFYLFNMAAKWLRRLSGIERREATRPRALDLGIQRRHDESRSAEISRYVHGGSPWAELATTRGRSEELDALRMPGWLPTAVVVNILGRGAKRRAHRLEDDDIITVTHRPDGQAVLRLPEGYWRSRWDPAVRPMEIIDGQHRLWAFDEEQQIEGDYELPVVAFHDLDVGWQAYLFWTINVKPKRISPSLAFDLYPLLRTQDWIEKGPEGPRIYRETRAQEITEALWSHPESPWHHRINMLGESRHKGQPDPGPVTQAAFIRSLVASCVKPAAGRRVQVGGLFGAGLEPSGDPLPWDRAQQAAFLILVWQCVRGAVRECGEGWAEALRAAKAASTRRTGLVGEADDPAFAGPYSLLATDQGVRGVLQVTNDLCFVSSRSLRLEEWSAPSQASATDHEAVSQALRDLRQHKSIVGFLQQIAADLATFDWRTSATPELPKAQRDQQAIFRGSGGYRALRQRLLELLADSSRASVKRSARTAKERLGY